MKHTEQYFHDLALEHFATTHVDKHEYRYEDRVAIGRMLYKNQANARLIAAAPELLEALYTVLDLATKERPEDTVVEIEALCRRVVAKAQGEQK